MHTCIICSLVSLDAILSTDTFTASSVSTTAVRKDKSAGISGGSTHQAVTVADGHSGSWRIGDVAYIQAVVVQGLRVPGAVAVITPLHLGSGGHQPGIVVQAQVELPAEDGDVVVKPFPRVHGLGLPSRFFPLIIAYSYLPPPAPTGLPSCHAASRDGV